MYIYSMETHIPYALNNASRNFDESKAETLGPFSFLLNAGIQATENEYRIGAPGQLLDTEYTSLYRGSKMTAEDIEEYIDSKGEIV